MNCYAKKMNAVIRCDEEEYAPFFATLWKLPGGWRWIAIPLRGPSEMMALPMTLIGIWRFARKPQRLSDLAEDAFVGARIDRICPNLGSYGMGGPGFWGLRCRHGARSFWIVYRLWSADGWVTIDADAGGWRRGYAADCASNRRFGGSAVARQRQEQAILGWRISRRCCNRKQGRAALDCRLRPIEALFSTSAPSQAQSAMTIQSSTSSRSCAPGQV
jgi:hypothetical protein